MLQSPIAGNGRAIRLGLPAMVLGLNLIRIAPIGEIGLAIGLRDPYPVSYVVQRKSAKWLNHPILTLTLWQDSISLVPGIRVAVEGTTLS